MNFAIATHMISVLTSHEATQEDPCPALLDELNVCLEQNQDEECMSCMQMTANDAFDGLTTKTCDQLDESVMTQWCWRVTDLCVNGVCNQDCMSQWSATGCYFALGDINGEQCYTCNGQDDFQIA
jgi:hypothetical protein